MSLCFRLLRVGCFYKRVIAYAKKTTTMELSERIRKIRKAYNLTQADIACRLDIAPSSYGQIERNAIKASCQTLLKVANAIGVSLTFLVDIESRKFVEDKNTG